MKKIKLFILLTIMMTVFHSQGWGTGILNFPDGKITAYMDVIYPSNSSYLKAKISNISPSLCSLTDGTYLAWCVDSDIWISVTRYNVGIYDTTDLNSLPSYAKTPEKWNPINYLLNHKGNANWQLFK